MMQATPPLYVIGIDIGTGSTKAVAVNNQGKVVTTAQEYYPTLEPQPGYSEQNPEAIWQAFITTLTAIQTRLQTGPACICLSSCMHSLLLLNKDGELLTNLITWADRRSAAVAERLRQTPEGEQLYAASGTPLHAMSPLCKLIWLRENDKAVFNGIDKAISIKEFIWWRLFGLFEVDHSIASATGLFNHHTFNWDKQALTLAGLRQEQLSQPIATRFMRSNLQPAAAALLQLPLSTKFCIGASDGCLANVGAGALSEGTAAVTVGTSGAVRIASKKPSPHFSSMLFSYVLDETTFICGAPVNNGGNVAHWLQQQFAGDTPMAYADLFEKAATVAAGSNGLVCLPYLYGERAPLWDEKAAGAFVGIRSHHGQGHFIRAALEGVCYSLKAALELIEQQTHPITTLHVNGGFIQSAFWVQLLANVTGKQLLLTQSEDASATGAALWGLETMGLSTWVAINEKAAYQTIYPNDLQTLVYSRYYPIQQSLYHQLRESMHQLYHLNQ